MSIKKRQKSSDHEKTALCFSPVAPVLSQKGTPDGLPERVFTVRAY
ncbi:hypothetical protein [Duodenibacillus massiliensis]|jgi:hypothetical protein|nr:hypothetical protein [uncultured Duodenibacillus sp.]